MKKYLLLILAVITWASNSWGQPDYSNITFKSKLQEYKKTKPNFKEVIVTKEDVKTIVTLLGSDFYNENEIQDITDRIWLSFNDPEKFDFVFKDMSIRTQDNWNKKNARGNIVLEPNPFWAEWTQSDGELQYFQKAFSYVLSYYKLMAYSDDAISTKKSLKKLLRTEKMNFKPAGSGDWTNSYLKYVNALINPKGYIALISNGGYDFMICKISDIEKIKNLMMKISWEFVNP